MTDMPGPEDAGRPSDVGGVPADKFAVKIAVTPETVTELLRRFDLDVGDRPHVEPTAEGRGSAVRVCAPGPDPRDRSRGLHHRGRRERLGDRPPADGRGRRGRSVRRRARPAPRSRSEAGPRRSGARPGSQGRAGRPDDLPQRRRDRVGGHRPRRGVPVGRPGDHLAVRDGRGPPEPRSPDHDRLVPGTGVLLISGTHAREWGGPDILINLAADLLEAWSAGTGLVYGGTSFTAAEVAGSSTGSS